MVVPSHVLLIMRTCEILKSDLVVREVRIQVMYVIPIRGEARIHYTPKNKTPWPRRCHLIPSKPQVLLLMHVAKFYLNKNPSLELDLKPGTLPYPLTIFEEDPANLC